MLIDWPAPAPERRHFADAASPFRQPPLRRYCCSAFDIFFQPPAPLMLPPLRCQDSHYFSAFAIYFMPITPLMLFASAVAIIIFPPFRRLPFRHAMAASWRYAAAIDIDADIFRHYSACFHYADIYFRLIFAAICCLPADAIRDARCHAAFSLFRLLFSLAD